MVLVLVSLGLVLGCKKSADQKLADANANALESQENADNAVNQSVAEQEWQKYKNDAEIKIAEHEKIIADYRAKMTSANGKLQAKYDKKIDDLDRTNLELKTKLNDYKDEGKTKWEQFKSEFDNDLNGLGTALKAFVVVDKK